MSYVQSFFLELSIMEDRPVKNTWIAEMDCGKYLYVENVESKTYKYVWGYSLINVIWKGTKCMYKKRVERKLLIELDI